MNLSLPLRGRVMKGNVTDCVLNFTNHLDGLCKTVTALPVFLWFSWSYTLDCHWVHICRSLQGWRAAEVSGRRKGCSLRLQLWHGVGWGAVGSQSTSQQLPQQLPPRSQLPAGSSLRARGCPLQPVTYRWFSGPEPWLVRAYYSHCQTDLSSLLTLAGKTGTPTQKPSGWGCAFLTHDIFSTVSTVWPR